MADTAADKSIEPTPHRRQQAREQGQVAKSHDLASAALLLAGLGGLVWLGRPLVDFFAANARQRLGGEAWLRIDGPIAVALWHATVTDLGKLLLPLLGLLLFVAIGLNLLQSGWLFLPEKLAPDWSRIDPFQGAGRIFSLSSVVRLALGIVKLLVIGIVAYASLYRERETILAMTAFPVPRLALALCEVLFWASLKIAGGLLLLSLIDYLFQWWKHEQDLKMTPQEVREEMRNLQGDPAVIARRKAVQRQLVLNRLSTIVPKADVVATNPTELAIAIQYDPETMNAPIVLAKGAGVLAQRIRKLALEHGIPIVEKKPLAQALYKDVEVNRPIPQKLYAAVAELLAYVYQLKGKTLPGARPSSAA